MNHFFANQNSTFLFLHRKKDRPCCYSNSEGKLWPGKRGYICHRKTKDTKVNFLVRSFFCIYSFSKIIRSRYGDGGNYFRKASQIIKINSVLTFLDVLAHLHLPLSLVFSTDSLYFSLYFVIHSDWVSLSEKTLDCYFLSGSEQQIPFCFSFCF